MEYWYDDYGYDSPSGYYDPGDFGGRFGFEDFGLSFPQVSGLDQFAYAPSDYYDPLAGFETSPSIEDVNLSLGGGYDPTTMTMPDIPAVTPTADILRGSYGEDGWESPAGPGMFEQLGRNISKGLQTPGGLVKAGTGALAAGLTAKGLFGNVPRVKAPNRGAPMQLSPQEQAAAHQMALSRQAASGTMEERGYAGEEGIRKLTNEKLRAALQGQTDLVNPRLKRELDDRKQAMIQGLIQQIGPDAFRQVGGEMVPWSTPAVNAMKNFDLMAYELMEEDRRQQQGQLHGMGMQRSQFYQQLQQEPFEMARAELGMLAPIAQGQSDAEQRAAIVNAQRALAEKQGALQTGGRLAGTLLGGYLDQDSPRNRFYEEMIQDMRRRRQG